MARKGASALHREVCRATVKRRREWLSGRESLRQRTAEREGEDREFKEVEGFMFPLRYEDNGERISRCVCHKARDLAPSSRSRLLTDRRRILRSQEPQLTDHAA